MTATVVLVAPPGSWSSGALTIEVACGLAAALPAAVRIAWWAPDAEDAWLAGHDLAAAALTDRVTVDRSPTRPPAAVAVHTGLPSSRREVPDPAPGPAGAEVGLGRDGIGPFSVEDLVLAVAAAVEG